MAIEIGHGRRSDLQPILMSSGLTSVFVDVLAIASSNLANTDRQKEMAVWLASHDQVAFGAGVVEFDICDYPWDHSSFDSDKEFLLMVIRAAMSQHGWSRLGYSPRIDWITDCLVKFENIVRLFLIEHILPIAEQTWHLLKNR